jgi:glycosidase
VAQAEYAGYARDGQAYYAAFNFTIPDLNHNNTAVRDEFRKIAKFWINKGVDGFRIDAARYLIENGPNQQTDTPETIKYLHDFAAYVKTINPNVYVVAEVYAGVAVTEKYYMPGGMDAVFCFDIGGKGGSIQGTFATGKTAAFYQTVDALVATAREGVPSTFYSHFFSNHDSGRLPENLREPDKIKAAAVAMFTIPGGAPYIYYGDEIGEREGFNMIGDANKRNPMWWNGENNAGFTTRSSAWVKKMKVEFYTNCNVALQIVDPQSTLSLFRKLIRLREAQPVLQNGSYEYIKMDLTHMTMTDEPETVIDKNPLIPFV